jgi:GT2 family glycosyltransferase
VLSVVVPVRNAPGHLRACLASLAASTFADREVLVVDDASTDETAQVAHEAGARVIRQERQGGPAAARNRGAREAQGEHLVFVDADVCVHPDTLEKMAGALTAEPELAAVFGSYDTHPASPAFVSEYKNLSHHFVHQEGREEASTFWAGCGAIRRAVFLEAGGFDERYVRPCIEDIELGARLVRAGRRIRLRRDVLATHLKRWTLKGLVRSDIWDRGAPWTELMLRERALPDDLNLRTQQRASAALAWMLLVSLAVASWSRPVLLVVPIAVLAAVVAADAWTARGFSRAGAAFLALALTGPAIVLAWSALGAGLLIPLALAGFLVLLNRRFYAFLARVRHPLFALGAFPLHLLYYTCSGIGLALGSLRYVWRTLRSPRA